MEARAGRSFSPSFPPFARCCSSSSSTSLFALFAHFAQLSGEVPSIPINFSLSLSFFVTCTCIPYFLSTWYNPHLLLLFPVVNSLSTWTLTHNISSSSSVCNAPQQRTLYNVMMARLLLLGHHPLPPSQIMKLLLLLLYIIIQSIQCHSFNPSSSNLTSTIRTRRGGHPTGKRHSPFSHLPSTFISSLFPSLAQLLSIPFSPTTAPFQNTYFRQVASVLTFTASVTVPFLPFLNVLLLLSLETVLT